jgi:NAD binding domain of 6-phosphogluconate dehydrogenase
MAERVAVLGTGIMGTPMARSLMSAGFQVRMWNRTPEKARVLAAEGADLAETPADAVREAAFVITMLTDAAAVLQVMAQAAKSVPDGARLAPDQHRHGRGARRPVREGPRDHVRELSGDRHQGDGEAGPAGRAGVRTRRRPRTRTANLRRDRVEDRQARARGPRREPPEAPGDRLDRGDPGEPPRPAEPLAIAIVHRSRAESARAAIRPERWNWRAFALLETRGAGAG